MADIDDANEKLASEYDQIRDDFDFGFILVGLVLVLSVLYCAGVIGGGEA